MADNTAFIGLLSIALQAVSAKAILLLSMLITGGLYSWAMWAHEWIALATAATWSVLVFLPILLKGDSHGSSHNETS